jgi:hypothetical protein
MAKRLKLVTPHQTGDPLRLKLGQVIAEKAKLKADLAADEAAESRGRALVAELERELERAAADVAASGDQDAGAYAEAIAAGRPLPASTAVQAAITKQTEVKLKLEAARTGLARIRSDHDEAGRCRADHLRGARGADEPCDRGEGRARRAVAR